MKYLLDTHALTWYLEASDKLSKKVFDIITDTDNQLYVSIATHLTDCLSLLQRQKK
jgi:PIN domain nuclease of toxin-antitoxin system